MHRHKPAGPAFASTMARLASAVFLVSVASLTLAMSGATLT